jgi:hypothetical protein
MKCPTCATTIEDNQKALKALKLVEEFTCQRVTNLEKIAFQLQKYINYLISDDIPSRELQSLSANNAQVLLEIIRDELLLAAKIEAAIKAVI